MNNHVLQLEYITRDFSQGGEALHILRGVNLQIREGEMVGLIGPSGSGKSTLLQIAGLLDTPTGGKVRVAGQDCTGAVDRVRTRIRRNHIGFVYQFHHLQPEFSALENVMIPQLIAGMTERNAKERAVGLLSSLGLHERMSHRPARLSGGEQQRVAIARALANNPKLLLADEPTGNLDPETAGHVFSLFMKLAQEKAVGVLLATHNLELANRMHRQVRLQAGVLESV